MQHKEIQNLIKLISTSNLSEFRLKDGEFEIKIRTKHYNKGNCEHSSSGHMTHAPIPSIPISAPVESSAVEKTSIEKTVQSDDNKSSNDTEAPQEQNEYLEIKSPIVGTFYRSSSPDSPPFVKIGDYIKEGDTVCIVEAMKLFNEIESEIKGKVVKILVDDSNPVEYDQVLFLVDPNG